MSVEPPGGRDRPWRGWSRWIMVLLVISLSLNLVVAGAVIARQVFHAEHKKHKLRFGPLLPRGFVRDLPSQRREALAEVWRSHRDEVRNERAALNRTMLDAADIVAAPQLDEEQFGATMQTFTAAVCRRVESAAPALRAVIAELTPEERVELAQHLRRRAERRMRRLSR